MLLVTGFDGSEHASAALKRADQLAKRFGAEHHVILVSHIQSFEWVALSNPYQIDLYGLEETHLSEIYEKAAASLEVPATVVMRRGEPAHEIVKYASDVKADFIIVGSRGRGGLSSLLLGSTSHGVIHGANCDVIVVKGEPAAE